MKNDPINDILASILEHQAEIEHDLAMIQITRPDVAKVLDRIRQEQKDLGIIYLTPSRKSAIF